MNRDQEIHRQIGAALTREPRVQLEKAELHITLNAGRVTLSGKLPGVAAKRLALSLAAAVPGVVAVDDQTRVATPEHPGKLELLDHLRHSLIMERNLEEQQIVLESESEAGVILRGTVHSLAQRRLAEVLAWWTPGVGEVRNLIVVDPPEEDSNEELRDNLEVIFDKDRLVDRSQIRTRVRDGMVTLQGLVRNRTERSAAEKDCWYTPGVRDVDNQLLVA